MHLLLTDRLTCPRCGPDFGLILMAGETADRRVSEGHLGCFNCREQYPVEAGVADLRPPPRGPPPPGEGLPPDDPEDALRLAAFLGVREGPGNLLLIGRVAGRAERVAAMIPDIEVVAVHPALESRDGVAGVSRLRISDRIPFQSYSIRGVALDGEELESLLEEAIRVLAPASRLVVIGPGAEIESRLEDRELELLLVTDRTVVAQR